MCLLPLLPDFVLLPFRGSELVIDKGFFFNFKWAFIVPSSELQDMCKALLVMDKGFPTRRGITLLNWGIRHLPLQHD
jgi:hypothetical protein